jgi:hypothetical protein
MGRPIADYGAPAALAVPQTEGGVDRVSAHAGCRKVGSESGLSGLVKIVPENS